MSSKRSPNARSHNLRRAFRVAASAWLLSSTATSIAAQLASRPVVLSGPLRDTKRPGAAQSAEPERTATGQRLPLVVGGGAMFDRGVSTTEVYERLIDRFTEMIDGLKPEDWAAATPCEGWTVRDLVRHVVERDQRIAAMVGGPAPEPLPDGSDLVRRWHERVRWWADRLADPQQLAEVHSTPLGELTFEQATARFMIGELTVHTWDLARAT